MSRANLYNMSIAMHTHTFLGYITTDAKLFKLQDTATESVLSELCLSKEPHKIQMTI